MPSDNAGTKSRTGGMSVSLASPDGRIVGGGVVGLLVAASPVQVCLFSLICGSLVHLVLELKLLIYHRAHKLVEINPPPNS